MEMATKRIDILFNANKKCKYCSGDGYIQDIDACKISVQLCEACNPIPMREIKLIKEQANDSNR